MIDYLFIFVNMNSIILTPVYPVYPGFYPFLSKKTLMYYFHLSGIKNTITGYLLRIEQLGIELGFMIRTEDDSIVVTSDG